MVSVLTLKNCMSSLIPRPHGYETIVRVEPKFAFWSSLMWSKIIMLN